MVPLANYTALTATTGGPQTFDFTSFENTYIDFVDYSILNASGQPGASSFPTATACINTRPIGEVFSSYVYYLINGSGAKFLGDVIEYDSSSVPIVSYTNTLTGYEFPSSIGYNSSWRAIRRSTLEADTLFSYVEDDTIDYLCDGYGTCKSSSSQVSVLRIKELMRITFTTTYGPPLNQKFTSSSSNLSYIFLAPGYFPVAEVDTSYMSGSELASSDADSRFIGQATAVDNFGESVLPSGFRVMQNYPNPFNPSTRITYSIPKSMPVSLDILNIVGERVSHLEFGTQEGGVHEYNFDLNNVKGAKLPSGMYFYRINAGDQNITRKMILLK
jgi:hypothetical protein